MKFIVELNVKELKHSLIRDLHLVVLLWAVLKNVFSNVHYINFLSFSSIPLTPKGKEVVAGDPPQMSVKKS